MNMGLNLVSNTALNAVWNIVSNTALNTVLIMVSNTTLNTVLNMVSNTNSSRNTDLVSSKQFVNYSFHIASFFYARFRFYLIYSFIRVNVSNSIKISEYSSSEMDPSDNAFEMRLLIVLSDKTANNAIFSCFSVFDDSFLIAWFPNTQSKP